MILVTGATGNTGREVVSQLLDAGAAVRALAREPDWAGLPDGVEVTRGDLSEPNSLDASLEGVEAVFLLWPLFTAEALSWTWSAGTRDASSTSRRWASAMTSNARQIRSTSPTPRSSS